MALINNPLGELLAPMGRLEASVGELGSEIAALRALPEIHDELAATHESMLLMLEEVRGIRDDIGRLIALLAGLIEQTGRRAG